MKKRRLAPVAVLSGGAVLVAPGLAAAQARADEIPPDALPSTGLDVVVTGSTSPAAATPVDPCTLKHPKFNTLTKDQKKLYHAVCKKKPKDPKAHSDDPDAVEDDEAGQDIPGTESNDMAQLHISSFQAIAQQMGVQVGCWDQGDFTLDSRNSRGDVVIRSHQQVRWCGGKDPNQVLSWNYHNAFGEGWVGWNYERDKSNHSEESVPSAGSGAINRDDYYYCWGADIPVIGCGHYEHHLDSHFSWDGTWYTNWYTGP